MIKKEDVVKAYNSLPDGHTKAVLRSLLESGLSNTEREVYLLMNNGQELSTSAMQAKLNTPVFGDDGIGRVTFRSQSHINNILYSLHNSSLVKRREVVDNKGLHYLWSQTAGPQIGRARRRIVVEIDEPANEDGKTIYRIIREREVDNTPPTASILHIEAWGKENHPAEPPVVAARPGPGMAILV